MNKGYTNKGKHR